MNVETDGKGKVLPLVVPTKEEFDAWVSQRKFTKVSDYLEGYAILSNAIEKVSENIEDHEGQVTNAIVLAQMEIESYLYNLFVCAFKDFAEKEGGAK